MEIGGYMSFEEYDGAEYHNATVALNTGRNCLRYLIRTKKITKILLPSYLCSAIVNVCIEEKIEYMFYQIDRQFKPILKEIKEKDTFLYVINYFGQLSNDYLKDLSDSYPNIIIDNAQAFFQMPVAGIDTIYTCRKFFGVPDGAYLYTNRKLDVELKGDLSVDRWKNVIGRYEGQANLYYEEYRKNEDVLDKLEMMTMSTMTRNVLRSLDYKKINLKRVDNARVLEDKLGKYNQLNINVTENGLYAYPMLVENGRFIREKLINEKIYVPTLWTNVLLDEKTDEGAKYLTENLLPLPCDQRYTIEHMEYLAERVLDLL